LRIYKLINRGGGNIVLLTQKMKNAKLAALFAENSTENLPVDF